MRRGFALGNLHITTTKKQSAGPYKKEPTGSSRHIHSVLRRKHVQYFKPKCGPYARIRKNPRFTELVSKRQGFATLLSVIVLTIFYGFFMVVAFNPNLIGQRLSEGSYVTVGIAAELFMFIFFWVLTAVMREARQRRV